MVIMNFEKLVLNSRIILFVSVLFLLIIMLFLHFKKGKITSNNQVPITHDNYDDHTNEIVEYHDEHEYDELESDSEDVEMF